MSIGHQSPRIICLHIAILLCICFASGVASAKSSQCKKLFKSQKYTKAAACYERHITLLASAGKLDGLKMLRLDRLLRHAAFSYTHAAKKSKSLEEIGYLRQQASILLMRSFRGGTCQSTNRCRAHRLLADDLRKKIKYTPLLVLTGRPETRIAITGYKYQDQRKHNFNGSLRPGRYKIEIYAPGKTKPRVKHVVLRPHRAMTLNVTPYRIKVVLKHIHVAKKLSAWIWLGYLVGGALTVAGAGLVIYGATEQERLNSINVDPIANQKLSVKDYHAGFDTAQGAKVIGIVIGSLGVAVGVAGILMHTTHTTRKYTAKPRLEPTKATSIPPQSHLMVLQ